MARGPGPLAIANRGEIAIRIARTAREMGIETVALATADERDAPYTRAADRVAPLPGVGPRGFLDIAAVVAAARSAGALALHPGYGLLSENADLARGCREAGLLFVGPAPETLALFGDKTRARAAADAAGVPVLAGTGPVDPAGARAFIASLGRPGAIALKAVHGGGGRGLRIVRGDDDLDAAFARAASEAAAAFGSPELFAEEWLEPARHVEVQVAGDGATVVALGTRECSLQRRHQKLVEIAPAIGISRDMLRNIEEAAVRIAAAACYRTLGTMEFLVSGNRFVFLEGNARLQVEHTVTEAVLGLDLVALQIRLADGRALADLLPEPPAARGVAIQLRLNCETVRPDGSVLPAAGTIARFQAPAGPGLRVDSWMEAGAAVNPAFDSLGAKIIAHAADWPGALARAARALAETRVEGVATNRGFLARLLGEEGVAAGAFDTGFVDRHLDRLSEEPVPDPLAVLSAAPVGAAAPVAPTLLPEGTVGVAAPMAGILVAHLVGVGDTVAEGMALAIVEAMKMEHEVRCTESGTVKALFGAAGQVIVEGSPLLAVAPHGVSGPMWEDAAAIDPDHVRPDLAEALARVRASHDVNRPAAVARRHSTGRRTARENLADLLDPGSLREYGSTVVAAQRRRRSMEDLVANTSTDGLVCGLGTVNGRRVVALSYDYMVLAGTQGKLNHYKKDRMFEIARRERLPVVLFAEGGGGRPGDTDASGVAGLDCLAFNLFAQLSGLVPLIGITTGRCFAGNAILLGCCDLIIATAGSNIGVGGPAMIEGGGLGVFPPDAVGPMDVQVPNGVVDVAVADEAEAVAVARRYLGYFAGAGTDWEAPDPRLLRHIVPENRKRWYDMRSVIDGIADIGSILELRREFGVGIITALARVEGRPIGIIANNPGHLSGAIDAPAADKAARFLQLLDAFDIPALSLIDCPGIMVGPEIEKTALVRHASRLMVVGANLSVPFLSVVVRKGYGLGAQAMAGGSFRAPLFIVTWPTGEFGGMGLEGAVKLGFRKELEAIADPAERQRTYERMVAESYARGSAVNMASHFEVDEVIDPAETRGWIVAGLRAAAPSQPRTGKKRPHVDTW
jgi:acetyl/propionyl-CoA carboxylase alpha subunit/acetyl-CoA carboxylase carboxyltransferase component